MSKIDERKKIIEAMIAEDFETACKEQGFTVCHTAEEGKGKKKANI